MNADDHRPDEPAADCRLCPRLAAFRDDNRRHYPAFFNRPVPGFGPADAALLVVGLAPGLKGANRTGRPFTGDGAGERLYPALHRFGFARGDYRARADDGLRLVNCRIVNTVRCVPPGNRPTAREIKTCLAWLRADFQAMTGLRVVLALGRIAHDAIMTVHGLRKAAHPFGHGAQHRLPGPASGGPILVDSYHCSRYNTNTGRLTETMFHAVFADIRRHIA